MPADAGWVATLGAQRRGCSGWRGHGRAWVVEHVIAIGEKMVGRNCWHWNGRGWRILVRLERLRLAADSGSCSRGIAGTVQTMSGLMRNGMTCWGGTGFEGRMNGSLQLSWAGMEARGERRNASLYRRVARTSETESRNAEKGKLGERLPLNPM
jgi:hypothetical protein